MTFLSGIITLFVTVLLALFVNRIAAVMLVFTGMSREMARFQARSAFSTVGFTTTESESVVNHPVRRQIIATLMLLGNAGFVVVIASLLGTFSAQEEDGIPWERKVTVLAVGLALLWAIGMSKWVDNRLFSLISWALKHLTRLEVHDFTNLLHLGAGYSVTELTIDLEDWLVGQRLDELRLTDVGINVLGIQRRSEEYVGTPTGDTYLRAGDKLIVYGDKDHIVALDEGRGDADAGERHRDLVEAKRSRWRQEADARGEGYRVTEMVVRRQGWLAGKRLGELRLGDVGVNVLGIKRVDQRYVGAPAGATRVYGDDTLIVYASREDIEILNETRGDPEGERRHHELAADRRQRHQDADAATQQEAEEKAPEEADTEAGA